MTTYPEEEEAPDYTKWPGMRLKTHLACRKFAVAEQLTEIAAVEAEIARREKQDHDKR